MVLRFSQHFNIVRTYEDNWYDTVLDRDIKLFIDPFLVKKSEVDIISEAYHKSFINFFQKIMEKIAEGKINNFKRYEQILSFPEVSNLCLGFSDKPKNGSGMGKGFAKKWYEAILNLLEIIGTGDLDSIGIEISSFLVPGIGKDMISDLTANLIKKELITYTQDICKKYSIPMEKVPISKYEFDFDLLIWEDKKILLPINPDNQEGIILVPEDILRVEPTLNLKEFRGYLKANADDDLRRAFDIKFIKDLNNKKLLSVLSTRPDVYKEFYDFTNKNFKKDYYDTNKDKNFLIGEMISDDIVEKEFKKLKDRSWSNESEFKKLIIDLCMSFKHSIENQTLIRALWSKGSPVDEKTIQAIFQTHGKEFCKLKNIDMSPETDNGRGPVDFKFSCGDSMKFLVELKLTKSSSLLPNAKNQLKQYLLSEMANEGLFMTISYFDTDLEEISKVDKIVGELNKEENYKIHHLNIDARNNKVSASKLK